ncbi:MAG: cohesin domain-containing protein [Bacteroidota bacterium]
MNKIVTILVAALLFVLPAAHAQPSFSITPATINGNPGDTVSVSVVVSNFTEMLSIQYGIKWDAAVLQYVGVEDINLFSMVESNFNVNADGDFLSLSWFDGNTTGVTVPDGTAIYRMRFVVIGEANTATALTFAERPGLTIEFTAEGVGEVTNNTTTNNGQFGDPANNNTGGATGNTSPLISSISTGAGQNGTTVCVDISVGNFTDITSMNYSLVWDASVIQFTEVRNFNLAGLTQANFNTSNTSGGQLGVSWDNNAGLTIPNGNIYQACFNLIGNAGTSSNIAFGSAPTPISVTTTASTTDVGITQSTGVISVSNTPPPPPPTTGDNLVNIGNITAASGSEVCVPVTVNDFDEILSLQFSLQWDASILQLDGVQNLDALGLSESVFNQTQAASGRLAFAYSDPAALGVTLNDGTTIFELCFTVLGASGASSTITFTDTPTTRTFADNDGEKDLTQTNGSVTVSGGTPPPPPMNTDIVNIGTIQSPAGSTVCIPVTVNDFDLITSLQFSLEWDETVLEFTEVGAINLEQLAAGNISTAQAANGEVAVAWIDNSTQGVTLADGTAIFELCFRVIGQNGASTNVTFTDTPTERLVSDAVTNAEDSFVGGSGQFTVGTTVVDPPPPPMPSDTGLVNVTSVTAATGSTVCIPITVNDFTLVNSLQFSLNWDPNFLDFQEIQNISLDQLTTGNFNLSGTDNGEFAVAWLDNTTAGITLEDGSTIFEMCFDVLGTTVGETSTIAFSDTPVPQVFSDNTGELPFEGGSGVFTVGEGTIDPPPPPNPTDTALVNVASLTAAAGSNVCVPITVNNFDLVNSLQFSLSWDPSFVSFTEIQNITLDQLTAGNINTTEADNGQLGLAWLDNTTVGVTLADGASIFEVCYDVLGTDGMMTTIAFSDMPVPQVFSNGDGEFSFRGGDGVLTVGTDTVPPPPPDTMLVLDKLVNIPQVTVESGTDFCVPITVNDFDDLAALQFSLGWNQNIIEFTGVQNFGIEGLTLGANFNSLMAENGVLTFAWADPAAQGIDLTDGTVIFEACFSAIGANGTSTAIAFTDIPTPREAATSSVEVTFSQTDGLVIVDMGGDPCMGPITAIATPTNVSCNGDNDGAISLEVSGGDGTFTYTWSDPSIGNIPNPTGLAAGTYDVTITSCNGQQVKSDIPSASLTITEPPAIQVVATPQNATCFGLADGRINVSLSGGTLPYTYTWSDTTLAPDNRPVNASAGTYSLTITDASGCSTVTAGIVVSSPSEIVTSVTTTNASCSGLPDGTATLVPTGGSGGDYTYDWGNPAIIGASPTNVPAGNYSVTVTDGNQCTAIVPVTVMADVVLSGTVQVIEDACGDSNGGIQITPSGGTEPYSYAWAAGPVDIGDTNTAENIPTGTYTVTITDSEGCFFVETIEVGGPVATLAAGANVQNVDCPGDDAGSITLTATGGFSPYTFAWSNGANTATIDDLVEGDYTVTISDSKVCTYVETFTIAANSNMIVSVEVTKGAPDAEATATVTGGVEPYTYEWCDGQDGETATGLNEGMCTLTVIDALGCTVVQTFEVMNDNPIATITVSNPISCNAQEDGGLTVSVEGGNPDYTFNWSNGGRSATINNLSAGTYAVTVEDASGNMGTASFDLPEPDAIVIDQTELTAVCEDEGGKVCISISGGTTPYRQIRWSNGVENELCIEDLMTGEYGVIVTDQNDCTQEENFRVTSDPSCIECYLSNMVMTPNDDGRNDAFSISCVDLAANNNLKIFNRWGQLVFEADNYQCVIGTESDCWRGATRNGNGVVGEGGYFWVLEFEDANGRQQIKDHFTILDNN